jgi:putative membrane protein
LIGITSKNHRDRVPCAAPARFCRIVEPDDRRDKMMRFVPIAAVTLAFAAPAMAQSTTPAGYVAAAGAGDLYEKTSSQLVLQSTRNAGIRSFARMMVTDHAKSTAMVKAAATKSGVRPAPPALTPAQNEMVTQLRNATGAARDQAYLTQQRTAHQQALALHRGYAADGGAAPLKATAAKIVPVVQHHIEMLQGM